MSRDTGKRTDDVHHVGHPARPVVKKMRWPYALIWLVPVLAAGLAGYYWYAHEKERGPEITIRFEDGSGLKAGSTVVVHRGVQIGQVSGIELSDDKEQVLVKVQLRRSEEAFARRGAEFWVVRPEVTGEQVSGLGTVLSGPVISSRPGSGAAQQEFTGLKKTPTVEQAGLKIVLRTAHLEHLQAESPVYYRGIQVGKVQEVSLAADATGVDIHAVIDPPFAPLVRANSQFWAASGVDLKGGILTGVQVKVESLRAVLSGGIAFATPDVKMGEQAQDGAFFTLNDEPKKEWEAWMPKIPLGPGAGEK
jgi:paraquat-inducible protein B